MEDQRSSQCATPTIIHGAVNAPACRQVPRVVRVVRFLTLVEIIVLTVVAIGIAAIPGFATTALGKYVGCSGTPVGIAITLVMCAMHVALNLWMYWAMGARTTAVWYVEVVCAVVGILSLLQVFVKHSNVSSPVLQAAIYGVILFYWLKPETKRYFNVR